MTEPKVSPVGYAYTAYVTHLLSDMAKWAEIRRVQQDPEYAALTLEQRAEVRAKEQEERLLKEAEDREKRGWVRGLYEGKEPPFDLYEASERMSPRRSLEGYSQEFQDHARTAYCYCYFDVGMDGWEVELCAHARDLGITPYGRRVDE
jgi:hypothetical protein